MSNCSEGNNKVETTGANKKAGWLEKINNSIETGEFAELRDVLELFEEIKQSENTNLHVFILASRGGVDSYLDHLFAFLKTAKSHGVKPFVHLFSDGEDVSAKQFLIDLPEIEENLRESGATLASISGRSYAMNQDETWNKTEKVLKAFVKHKETPVFKNAQEYVKEQYKNVPDQEIIPAISEAYMASSGLQAKDVLVNLNFLFYGTRQLSHLLVGSGELYSFSSSIVPNDLSLYAMTDDPRMFLSGAFFR